MATTSQFLATPKTWAVHIGGTGKNPNTSRNGVGGLSGTVGTDYFLWFTAGSNGSRLDNFYIRAAGTVATTTAGCVRLWIKNTSDSNFYLLEEVLVSATLPAANSKGFYYAANGSNYLLPAGAIIYITSEKLDAAGNQFDIIATFGGDF